MDYNAHYGRSFIILLPVVILIINWGIHNGFFTDCIQLVSAVTVIPGHINFSAFHLNAALSATRVIGLSILPVKERDSVVFISPAPTSVIIAFMGSNPVTSVTTYSGKFIMCT